MGENGLRVPAWLSVSRRAIVAVLMRALAEAPLEGGRGPMDLPMQHACEARRMDPFYAGDGRASNCYVCRCVDGEACVDKDLKCRHKKPEIDCPYCLTSVCWAIVKDAKGMRDSGHRRAVAWARAVLDLDDQKSVIATRATHDPEGDVNVSAALRRGFTSVKTTTRSVPAAPVTDKVSREQDEEQSALGGLGGEAMGLYHP